MSRHRGLWQTGGRGAGCADKIGDAAIGAATRARARHGPGEFTAGGQPVRRVTGYTAPRVRPGRRWGHDQAARVVPALALHQPAIGRGPGPPARRGRAAPGRQPTGPRAVGGVLGVGRVRTGRSTGGAVTHEGRRGRCETVRPKEQVWYPSARERKPRSSMLRESSVPAFHRRLPSGEQDLHAVMVRPG